MAEQSCPNCGKPYQIGDEVCRFCGLVFPFSTVVIPPGRLLQGRYEIRELIHTGGMGYIYLAKDKRLYDRDCIVKQVRESIKSDAHRKKLEEEASSMAKLDNPNIALILDHFVEDGYYFLVVERIVGKTLGEVFKERQGQLTEQEVLDWAVTICDVVGYLHSKNVLHRDISPDNIMLTENNALKFIDFGTSHEFRYFGSGGTVGIGKYGYTPPEQWRGKPEQRSDIFAMGATIYYLMTGFLPLSQAYVTGKAPQKEDFNPEYPPIRTKNPKISTGLESVLQKALQLDIDKRYATAADFCQTLRSLEPKGKKKPAVVKRPATTLPVWAWLSIAVIALAIIGVALKFIAFSGGESINDDGNTPVIVTTNASDNNTPEPTTTTPTTTNPPPMLPEEYVNLVFAPPIIDKAEVSAGDTFYITLSGNFTCLHDIPYPVHGLCILPRITARNASAGEILLIVTNNITAESIPVIQGDMTSFTQTLSVQFPAGAANGSYFLYLNADKIKINIGMWVDIEELFQLEEQSLGTVRYSRVESSSRIIEGYVRDAVTNAPVTDAMIDVIEYISLPSGLSYDSIRASGYSDSSGYYQTDVFSGIGTYIVRVKATGYATQWYQNVYDESQATHISFNAGENTLTINFYLTQYGSISGKVISNATGQAINEVIVVVTVSNSNTGLDITSVNVQPDGTYNITGLAPGDYYIWARAIGYEYNYYNNSLQFRLASLVRVNSGQDTPNIDFTLTPTG